MALIYDLGMHRAEDTAFYLWQGHAVVAIEPNPYLASLAGTQLRRFVDNGTLRILPTAISDESGTKDFWIPPKTQWASLNRNIAERDGPISNSVSVPVTTLQELISSNGAPHYLKIDIESSDKACLRSLASIDKPKYISVEAECLGVGERLDEQSAMETLDLLRAAGYNSFQLIDQYSLSSVRRGNLCPSRTGGQDARNLLTERIGWRFPFGSSGPWGEDLLGEWISSEEARNIYLAARDSYYSDSNAVSFGFWCDWHARLT